MSICICCISNTLLFFFQYSNKGASDFSALAGLNSTFTTGRVNGDTACISVSITDDDSLEGNEEFNVAIDSVADSSGGGNIVLTGVPSMGSVVIMDDEGKAMYIYRLIDPSYSSQHPLQKSTYYISDPFSFLCTGYYSNKKALYKSNKV